MTATVRAEGEQVIIEQGDARIVLSVSPGSPIALYDLRVAWQQAHNTYEQRRQREALAARIALFREEHPDAIEVKPNIWRDGLIVFDGHYKRSPSNNEINPPMKVKIGGGRVGHLWTGGDYMLCGKYGGRTSVTPCDLPPCPKCAAKAGA